MTSSLRKWLPIAAAFSGWTSAALAVGLTVTPNSITNDYAGKITFTITGLSPSQAILLEKYGDLNANGVIDAGEPVLQGGLLTDGTLPTIGGVRNLNVPGDEDGTVNGQVRMEVYYPGGDKGLDFIAAKYLIKMSDPITHAALATASFEVKQKVFPQGVTGQLTALGSGTPLANAMLVMMPSQGNPFTGTVTDANGNFTLYSAPGIYTVVPLAAGFVGDMNGTATVTASAFATLNLALPAATRTISGKLKDSFNGVGIPGVFIQVESTSGQFVSAFSDSAGNYSAGVLIDSWRLKPSSDSLTQLGYLGWGSRTNVSTVSGNVANFDLPVDQESALIYGTVTNNLHNPVIGIGIWADDQPNRQYDTSGRTFPPNASYCVAVRPGNWGIGSDTDTLSALGYTGRGTNVTLTANQAVRVDFVLSQVNAQLPTISSPSLLSNGKVQFMLTDAAGQYYTVEYSTDLSAWESLLTTNLAGGASLYLSFPTTNGCGFYRARGNTGFDGTYTGSWTKTCPDCNNETTAGTFTTTLVNGEFTNISLPITIGNSGIRLSSGTVSPSGVITGTGVAPIQCSESVTTFTGQITLTPSGGATMTVSSSRTASPGGCAAEYGTIIATRQ